MHLTYSTALGSFLEVGFALLAKNISLAFLYLPDLCSNTHIVQLNQVFYEIVYFFYLLNSFRVQPF
jgi:hypothetical protein